MPTEIELLEIRMEANTKRISNDLKKTVGLIDKSMNRIEQRTNKAERNIKRALSSAFSVAGSLGVYLSVGQVTRYADSWTLVQNAITATEELTGVALKNREELLDLSERSRSDLQATTQLYTRVAASITHITDKEEDFSRITETVAKALKLGGANAQEQAAAMLQLSQAFNKGKLDGDEFRSVAENARIITQGLADQLGVTRQEIIKMAADGKLTVDALVSSLLNISPEVDRAFAKTIPTIDQALTKLNGRITQYVGNLAETKGIAAAVRVGITGLAENFDLVGDTALVAGAAILGAFGPQAIAAVGRFGVALTASTGGLTAITGGLAAAYAAMHLFGDSIHPVAGELATLSDYGSATFDVLIDGAGEAAAGIRDNLIAAIGTITSALTGVGVSNEDVLTSFKKMINGALQLLLAFSNYLAETLIAAPKIFFEKVTAAANLMLRGIEAGINGAIKLLNLLVDAANVAANALGASISKIDEVELPELQSKFEGAGKRYGEYLAKGIKNGFHKDGAISNILEEISDRANLLAGERNAKQIKIGSSSKTLKVSKSSAKAGTAKQNNFDREVANLQKRISLLQLEQKVVGKSALEAEKARTAHSLLEAAKAANIPITESLKNKVNTLANGYATATVKLDEMKDAQENAAARAAELESTFQDATKGIVSGILEGRDAADVFADALGNISDRLLDLALDDVFAGLKGGGTSLFGGGTGGIFGGAIIPGIFHKGGVVGRDGGGHNRAVSPGVFNNAPRFHDGGIVGLKSDEVPAILQKGEIVIPKNHSTVAQKRGGDVTIAPVYQIDARGADSGVDEKIQVALSKNNEDLQRSLPAMIKNAEIRGRV